MVTITDSMWEVVGMADGKLLYAEFGKVQSLQVARNQKDPFKAAKDRQELLDMKKKQQRKTDNDNLIKQLGLRKNKLPPPPTGSSPPPSGQ